MFSFCHVLSFFFVIKTTNNTRLGLLLVIINYSGLLRVVFFVVFREEGQVKASGFKSHTSIDETSYAAYNRVLLPTELLLDMAATYALSIAATSAKVSPYDFKKPTYGHMNLGFLQQKVIINGAITGILALKRTLESSSDEERGQHDEAMKRCTFKILQSTDCSDVQSILQRRRDFLVDPWLVFNSLQRQTCIDFCWSKRNDGMRI